MNVWGIIPARLESSRLPGKLLLAETGIPLLQHTWEAASGAESLSRLLVATDSPKIARAVAGFGGDAQLTGDHCSGTDRIAEVVNREASADCEIVVNIQGDEPEIDPRQIDQLVKVLKADTSADMATLATPIRSLDLLLDSSNTKVVCGADGRALYFSRSMIPACRDRDPVELLDDSPWLLHLGLYAYRREFLLELASAPPTQLEQLEKLEQLRALEMGARLIVATVEHPSVGIDTPDDYAQFVSRFSRRAA